METKQPTWKLVCNMGDVSIAEYGGFLVYEDETGVYPPEVELYEANDNETGGTMYRFILERPRFKTLTEEGKRQLRGKGIKDANQQHKMWYWHNEWYVSKLAEVASFVGMTKFQLLRMLLGKDTTQRAIAYQILVSYFGPHEFDSYPVTLTENQAKQRYAEVS